MKSVEFEITKDDEGNIIIVDPNDEDCICIPAGYINDFLAELQRVLEGA